MGAAYLDGTDLDSHDVAVAKLRAEYSALPDGSPVRLAKPTSNLFRFRDPTGAPGLDVSRFGAVLSVDPDGGFAEVGGMTTYENLVHATLPHGLMPFVVPQLKTITLGGAVAGLGIESSSFRNGLPHESLVEAEILTGDGRIVVARADNEHAELFRGFPNSYGTLGYSLRLRIELERVRPYVRLAVERPGRAHRSDYTGQRIFYRSVAERSEDYLSVRDYLWRWDTDWFWCSQAFGVQNPLVRRLWPQRYLRSDVYRKLVALDRRHHFSDRLLRLRRQPAREPVIQDVEIPVDRLAEFLEFFHAEIGISPVWLCPLRLRSDQAWPLYPLEPDTLYVNVGFWSTVALAPGQQDGTYNRLIEDKVAELGGHKSLYSTSFYSPEDFWRLYNGDEYRKLKQRYDPDGRLPDLYAKCVRGR